MDTTKATFFKAQIQLNEYNVWKCVYYTNCETCTNWFGREKEGIVERVEEWLDETVPLWRTFSKLSESRLSQSNQPVGFIGSLADKKPRDERTIEDLVDTGLSKRVFNKEIVHLGDTVPKGSLQKGSWNFQADIKPEGDLRARFQVAEEGENEQHFYRTLDYNMRDNESFFFYVYLDPKNPPKSIMLQVFHRNWSHRAYWGEDVIGFGRDSGRPATYYPMGQLPEAGKWIRLEVDASLIDINDNDPIEGMAFTQNSGAAYWGRAGTIFLESKLVS